MGGKVTEDLTMGKYNKFFAALVGAAAVGATSAGYVTAPESEAMATSVLSLLAAFGVWGVPNK